MRIGLTGATGLAGHPIARCLCARGHEVVTLGRRPSELGLPHRFWTLGYVPDLAGLDAIVHAALSHEPERYRGGEGDDPDGFRRLNLDGSLDLLEAARDRAFVFLSSRAVYGSYPPGTHLFETMIPRPDTLYGQVKAVVERAVSATGGTSLRATGLYGPPPPGRKHKWTRLFRDFTERRSIGPRIATEVHADDLAQAVALLLEQGPPWHDVYNVSDIVLDRRDLLSLYGEVANLRHPLPARADRSSLCEMDTTRLRAAGWRPRGRAGLLETLGTIHRDRRHS